MIGVVILVVGVAVAFGLGFVLGRWHVLDRKGIK